MECQGIFIGTTLMMYTYTAGGQTCSLNHDVAINFSAFLLHVLAQNVRKSIIGICIEVAPKSI